MLSEFLTVIDLAGAAQQTVNEYTGQNGNADGHVEIACNDAGYQAAQNKNLHGQGPGGGPDLDLPLVMLLDIKLLQLFSSHRA